MGHRLLHHARRLDHLRQEHLAGAEQVADDVHAVHQRALDHLYWPAALALEFGARLLGVLDNPVGDAVHQRVRQPPLHRRGVLRRAAPFERLFDFVTAGLERTGKLDHAFGGVGSAVQYHVLDAFAQFGREVVIDPHHAGVDNAHAHAGFDGVIQKHRMDGFARRVVAAEGEADVGHPARDLGARQVGADPARRLDEIDAVVAVFVYAGGDGKDVRVENDVLGGKARARCQQLIGALADLGLARKGVGLALFVKGHHDHRGAVAPAQFGLAQELGFTLLHADGIDDGLALHALETGFDDLPLRRVDHDRHARNIRLRGDEVQETHHRRPGIEHRLIHVDVDHLGAVLDLLACHSEGLVVLFGEDQAGERLGAGDVGALADVDEQAVVTDVERFHARQAQHRFGHRQFARRQVLDRLGDGVNVLGRGAAAATGDVDQAGGGELLQQRRGDVRRFVKAGVAHRVGQAGVGIDANKRVAQCRQFFNVRAHQRGAQRAIEADGQRPCMTHRVPEGLDRLARQDAAGGVGDGARNHQRQAITRLLEKGLDGEQRRLGVERVEHRFEQENVDTALGQRPRLLEVGVGQLVEGDVARRRVIDIGRDRGCLGRRPERAGGKARPVGRGKLDAGGLGDTRRGKIHFNREMLEVVVGLGDTGGAEGVGLDDVGAGGEVLPVNFGNQRGLRQREQLVVTLHVMRTAGKVCAAISRLIEFVLLDHGAHGTVHDQDAAFEQDAQFGGTVAVHDADRAT